jgi:predicted house-cleaning NTP pyrophosphatase (Maf/HAM1 superfamily)
MPDVSNKPRLILASSSRYRRELLERLRFPFDVISPDIDETPLDGEAPEATAIRLSIAKARAAAVRVTDASGALVIGSDQVATCDGRQIGKPGTHDNARAQLQSVKASNSTVRSVSSIAVRTTSSPPISLRACSFATCRMRKSKPICSLKRLTTWRAARNRRAWVLRSSMQSTPTIPPRWSACR